MSKLKTYRQLMAGEGFNTVGETEAWLYACQRLADMAFATKSAAIADAVWKLIHEYEYPDDECQQIANRIHDRVRPLIDWGDE